MNYPDELITIDEFSEFSFKEKGSSFTGQVFHCESDDEAISLLASIKKKYYDATHHCFAYKLLSGTFRYSDDGEPKGTAGIRIFNAIEHFNLLNIFVVVIRYYGGTKLGIGPLGKAYHSAASEVLNNSKKIKKFLYQIVKIESDFEHISYVHRILSSHNATIASTQFGEKANFECLIKPNEIQFIANQLTDLSKGGISVNSTKAKYYK
jgi:uncharacterized YigZ family protein